MVKCPVAIRKPARKKASPAKASERGVNAAHHVFAGSLAKADSAA